MTATKTAGDRYEPTPADGPDHNVPLDADTINASIDAALAEPAVGADLNSDNLAALVQDLTGHLALLLPLASAVYRAAPARDRDPVLGHGIGYLQRRLTNEAPNAHTEPFSALAWAQESARYARQMLALVLAEKATEQQHAGVTRR